MAQDIKNLLRRELAFISEQHRSGIPFMREHGDLYFVWDTRKGTLPSTTHNENLEATQNHVRSAFLHEYVFKQHPVTQYILHGLQHVRNQPDWSCYSLTHGGFAMSDIACRADGTGDTEKEEKRSYAECSIVAVQQSWQSSITKDQDLITGRWN